MMMGVTLCTVKADMWRYALVLFLMLGIPLRGASTQPAVAQTPGCSKDTSVLLFEDSHVRPNGGGPIVAPFVFADQGGYVHVLWSHWDLDVDPTGETSSIYYMQRDVQGEWGPAVNVLISPSGMRADYPQASVDADGRLYVIWNGGGDVFVSSADVTEALDVHAWSPPLMVPLDGRAYAPVGLVLDADNVLHVVFSELGLGVFYLFSNDGGVSWSSPVEITPPLSRESTEMPKLRIDSAGTMYVVWTQLQLPTGYPPTGVYFSRSTDQGQSWNAPVQIAGLDDGEANLAQSLSGQLNVVYHGRAGIGGLLHRYSDDGGLTWSEPTTLVPRRQGGLTGAPGIAVDSAGTIHMIASQEYPNLWYGVWDGHSWGSLLDASTLLYESPQGYTEQPALAVGLGNQVHLVFYDNGQRLWYATCVASAPSLTPVERKISTQEFLGTPTLSATLIPTASPTPYPVLVSAESSTSTSGKYITVLAVPFTLCLFLVIAIVGLATRRK